MTIVNFYPRYTEQEGWCDAGGSPTPFQTNYFAGMSVETFRHFIFRFSDIDLPAGATITAANIIYTVYVKIPGDPNSFTYNHYYEPDVASGTVLRQDCLPLRIGVYEENTANRNWTQHITDAVFNWNTTIGPADQTFAVDVTSLVQTAYGTNAGRHMNFAFKLQPTVETGDLGISTNARNGFASYLRVEYTGSTGRNEVVLAAENPNLAITQANGLPEFWYNNSVFGFFSGTTTYSTAASHSGIVAPQGGNVLKLTATDTNRQAAWHRPPNHTFPGGTWSCFSAFVYVPTGTPNVQITSLSSLFTQASTISVKDTWQRIYVAVLHGPDSDTTMGLATIGDGDIGDAFYIANVNWTAGQRLYPYFDGASTDSATYHRTFDWGGGSTGKRVGGYAYVSLDNLPSVTPVDPQPSASTQQKFTTRWTYSDPYAESQARYRVEVRKKRIA